MSHRNITCAGGQYVYADQRASMNHQFAWFIYCIIGSFVVLSVHVLYCWFICCIIGSLIVLSEA